MFLLTQSFLIILITAAFGFVLGYWIRSAGSNDLALQEEIRPWREENDHLKQQMTASANSALTDAIGTRKTAALEAELAEARSRADELAAANAKLREVAIGGEDVAALKWRNKYLEARVLFFEGREAGGSVETPPMPEELMTTKLVQEIEPAPVAFVAAAAEPVKRGRKKSVVVPAPMIEPVLESVVEPVVEPAPVAFVAAAAEPVKRGRKKSVAMPAPMIEPVLDPVVEPVVEPAPVAFVAAAAEPVKRGRKKSVVVPAPMIEPVLEPVVEPVVEPAPVAFVAAAAEPVKRGRKKSVVVPAPMIEPVVERALEPEPVAAPIVKKLKAKAVALPPPPLEPISNQNFTPSPLAGSSAEALEEAIALAGVGKAPPRSRRRANPDELLLIDGVGPKNKAWLNAQGIYYFYQIATMNIDQVAWLSKNLPTFGARVYRENWVAQCTRLARGEPAR
jgi:predicted flap endonuclease-1-like 5' DNA nuclease